MTATPEAENSPSEAGDQGMAKLAEEGGIPC